MPEEKGEHIDYQKGFNEGYIIAKHMPELSNELSKIKSDSPRMEGLRDGREQFSLEKEKLHIPAWLKEDTTKNTPHIPPKDRDREHER